MTPADLHIVAEWHERHAETQAAIAQIFECPAANKIRSEATQHARWAVQLRELAASLENGTAMGAKVIEAGEHERRELLARIAVLEQENSKLQTQNSKPEGAAR